MKTNLKHAKSARVIHWSFIAGVTLIAALLTSTARAGNPELPVDLLSAGDFVILAKTGISTVPSSDIEGDMGVSPILSPAITGFALILDGSGEFSTSAQVTGKIYAPDYMPPTPAKMTAAISAMEAAYTEAAGRTIPDTIDLSGGLIGGLTFTPGLHTWGTAVSISTDVTLDAMGDPNAVFIFQISGDLIVASGQSVILAGGAQARNIFWQVAGGAGLVVGTTAHFEGIVLTQTAITLNTGASFSGKLLAQTRVNLDQNNIIDAYLVPLQQLDLEIVSAHGVATPAVGVHSYDFGASLTNTVTAVETIGSTQYVNTGWAMVGNEPVSGSTNEMAMVITNNAVLTWLWSTNYALNASVNPLAGGSITGDSNGWYAAGSLVSVTAEANSNYIFVGWTGNISGPSGDVTQNLTMSQARNVVANFVPVDLGCGTPVSLGAIMELDLDAMFSGAGQTYSAVSSDPGVMSEVITGDDLLRLEALAYGFSLISVTALDGGGNTLLQAFPVTVVDDVAIIHNEMMPNEPWNPRFEQRLVLENTTGLACPAVGLRLIFTDLLEGIEVENQTGVTPDDGYPMIEWRSDFPDGATQGVSVIYVSTGAFRPDLHPPTIKAQYILANGAVAPDDEGATAIDLIRVLEDGRIVLEFISVVGHRYQIDYTPSLLDDWITVPLLLTAGGNRTQWIDYGPPATPPLGDARLYRAREVTP